MSRKQTRKRSRRNPIDSGTQSLLEAIREQGSGLIFLNLTARKGKKAVRDEGIDVLIGQVEGLKEDMTAWRKGEQIKGSAEPYGSSALMVGRYELKGPARAQTGRDNIIVVSAVVKEKSGYDADALEEALYKIAAQARKSGQSVYLPVLPSGAGQKKVMQQAERVFGQEDAPLFIEGSPVDVLPAFTSGPVAKRKSVGESLMVSLHGEITPFQGKSPRLVVLYMPIGADGAILGRPEFAATANLGDWEEKVVDDDGRTVIESGPAVPTLLKDWVNWAEIYGPDSFGTLPEYGFRLPGWKGTIAVSGPLPSYTMQDEMSFAEVEVGSKTLLIFPISNRGITADTFEQSQRYLAESIQIAKKRSGELQRPLTYIEDNLQIFGNAKIVQLFHEMLKRPEPDLNYAGEVYFPRLSRGDTPMVSPLTGKPIIREPRGQTFIGEVEGTQGLYGNFEVRADQPSTADAFMDLQVGNRPKDWGGKKMENVYILQILDDCGTLEKSGSARVGGGLQGTGPVPLGPEVAALVSLTRDKPVPLKRVEKKRAQDPYALALYLWRAQNWEEQLRFVSASAHHKGLNQAQKKWWNENVLGDNMGENFWEGSRVLRGGEWSVVRIGAKVNSPAFLLSVVARPCEIEAGRRKGQKIQNYPISRFEFASSIRSFMAKLGPTPTILFDARANGMGLTEWPMIEKILREEVVMKGGSVYAYNVPNALERPKKFAPAEVAKRVDKKRWEASLRGRVLRFSENSPVAQWIIVIGKDPKKRRVMIVRRKNQYAPAKKGWDSPPDAFTDPQFTVRTSDGKKTRVPWFDPKGIPGAARYMAEYGKRLDVIEQEVPPRPGQRNYLLHPMAMRNYMLDFVNQPERMAELGFGPYSLWKEFLSKREQEEEAARAFMMKDNVPQHWREEETEALAALSQWAMWAGRALGDPWGQGLALYNLRQEKDAALQKLRTEGIHLLRQEVEELSELKKEHFQFLRSKEYKDLEEEYEGGFFSEGDSLGQFGNLGDVVPIGGALTFPEVEMRIERLPELTLRIRQLNLKDEAIAADFDARMDRIKAQVGRKGIRPEQGFFILAGDADNVDAYSKGNPDVEAIAKFYRRADETLRTEMRQMEGAPPRVLASFYGEYQDVVDDLKARFALIAKRLRASGDPSYFKVDEHRRIGKGYDALRALQERSAYIKSMLVRAARVGGSVRNLPFDTPASAARWLADRNRPFPPEYAMLEGTSMPVPYVFAIFENGAAGEINFNMSKGDQLWKQPGWAYQDAASFQIDDFWLRVLTLLEPRKDELEPQKLKGSTRTRRGDPARPIVDVDRSKGRRDQRVEAIGQISKYLRGQGDSFGADMVGSLVAAKGAKESKAIGKQIMRAMGVKSRFEGKGWLKGGADANLYRNLWVLSGGKDLLVAEDALKEAEEEHGSNSMQAKKAKADLEKVRAYVAANQVARRSAAGRWEILANDPEQGRREWIDINAFRRSQRDRAQSSARGDKKLDRANKMLRYLTCFVPKELGYTAGVGETMGRVGFGAIAQEMAEYRIPQTVRMLEAAQERGESAQDTIDREMGALKDTIEELKGSIKDAKAKALKDSYRAKKKEAEQRLKAMRMEKKAAKAEESEKRALKRTDWGQKDPKQREKALVLLPVFSSVEAIENISRGKALVKAYDIMRAAYSDDIESGEVTTVRRKGAKVPTGSRIFEPPSNIAKKGMASLQWRTRVSTPFGPAGTSWFKTMSTKFGQPVEIQKGKERQLSNAERFAIMLAWSAGKGESAGPMEYPLFTDDEIKDIEWLAQKIAGFSPPRWRDFIKERILEKAKLRDEDAATILN